MEEERYVTRALSLTPGNYLEAVLGSSPKCFPPGIGRMGPGETVKVFKVVGPPVEERISLEAQPEEPLPAAGEIVVIYKTYRQGAGE